VEIAFFAADPTNDLAVDLASRPRAGLDYCFGIVDRERLAAYSWYALRSIEGEHHVGVPMSFPANTAYMYKAFTHPDYRGEGALRPRRDESVGGLGFAGSHAASDFDQSRELSRRGPAAARSVSNRSANLWTLGTGARRIAWTPRAARQLGIQFGSRATVADRSVIA